MENKKDYKKTNINLGEYRVKISSNNYSKVFTGRDRGRTVRDKSGIDKKIEEFDKVFIEIPEDIYSINPSFLEEFLKNAVIKLGKNEFMKKVEFVAKGAYNVNKTLSEAVDRILHTETAIG